MKDSMMLIDKDRIDFLLYAIFGASKEPFPTVSKLAYLDLCRTIPLNGKNGSVCRARIDILLEKRALELLETCIATQIEFDHWHYETCVEMIDIYKNEDIAFTFGHAQKWINMTLKYLFIHGTCDLSEVFAYLHVPIDSYILAAVEKQLHIDRPCSAWSKMNDYSIYLDYQRAIREKLHNQTQPVAPLRWEFSNWLVEADKL